jgi:hypothetical protein
MIEQYAGPTSISVKITASAPYDKADKHINAFKSLLRKQKIKAICKSWRTDTGYRPVWKIEYDLDKMHKLQPYSQHIYYKKTYSFNLKETVQSRQVYRSL